MNEEGFVFVLLSPAEQCLIPAGMTYSSKVDTVPLSVLWIPDHDIKPGDIPLERYDLTDGIPHGYLSERGRSLTASADNIVKPLFGGAL
jgi:hypothetical protein